MNPLRRSRGTGNILRFIGTNLIAYGIMLIYKHDNGQRIVVETEALEGAG
jgi:hypothetical protein